MADRSRPRRTVAGSRNPSTAPRRVAGRSTRPTSSTSTEPSSERVEELLDDEAIDLPSDDRVAGQPGALSNPRTTKVLSVVLVALLVLGVVEAGVWAFARFTGDDSARHVMSFGADYVVRDDPVTVPMADWRDANDAAAKGVTEILNVSWKDYDSNLEDARKLITDRFAKEYSATAEDSRKLFMESKAEYDFSVVGQSVVEATPDEVATLLFLNQYVYKGAGKKRTGPDIYQVRVLVRMVRTDSGWLIDELHPL